MSLEAAAVVISGISALANVIGVWKKAKTEDTTLRPEQIEFADLSLRMDLTRGSVKAVSNVIPDDLLDTIKEDIDRARERLKKALKDNANTPQAKDAEVDVAESTICALLERIKRLNDGQLPDEEELKDLWISFSC